MAIAYDQLFPRPRRVPQLGTLANRQTMKSRLSIPYSPMVCVKLPKTVLVLFHLFRATKLPIFPGIDHP
jgi:hypothetical protein